MSPRNPVRKKERERESQRERMRRARGKKNIVLTDSTEKGAPFTILP